MSEEPKRFEKRPPAVDLDRFAATNPESSIEVGTDAVLISKPWGDDSLALRVSHEATAVADALNHVRLPPRFSAIWHLDTKDLEFIYAPLRKDDPVRERKFDFDLAERRFHCEFGDGSERLILLGNASRPVGPPSATDLRNLSGVRNFPRMKKALQESGNPVEVELTSFWIRGCDVPEADLPELARHINFYAVYFDRRTPRILIHEEPVQLAVERPTQFPFGAFPPSIAARRLDPYMLTLWESSVITSEPIRAFLYNYQILEYSAFYYLREDLARTIRKIVSSPDVVSRSDQASRQILDALVEERTSEEAKITSVVQQAVDPTALWREIDSKIDFFSEATEFDGGFVLPPLVKKGWELDDFRTAWIPKVPDSFRKLRNALLHAREQRMARCVAPTGKNQHLLRPWIGLIAVASSQVILYGEV